jgi:hypothetical protein
MDPATGTTMGPSPPERRIDVVEHAASVADLPALALLTTG